MGHPSATHTFSEQRRPCCWLTGPACGLSATGDVLGPSAPASLPCWLCCDADCCCEGAGTGTGAANAVVVVVPVKPAELFMALCKIALPNQEGDQGHKDAIAQ